MEEILNVIFKDLYINMLDLLNVQNVVAIYIERKELKIIKKFTFIIVVLTLKQKNVISTI